MPDGIVWPSLLSAGVEAENKTAVSLEEQPFSVKLPPIDLHASQSTFLELAAAMAAGAGLVALVGREGSGKTYMLEALTRAPQPADRVSVRTADQPVAKGASLDLVDAVDDAALRLLAAEPAFTGRRVVAIRPDTLDRLLAFDPAARVVQMRPIGWRDVRALLEERRKLFRLPPDQFTLKALSLLEKLCDGNPGRLDFLACHAILAAQAEKSRRVTTIQVVGAAWKLLAPSSRKAPPQRSEAPPDLPAPADATPTQIGRASCRERV